MYYLIKCHVYGFVDGADERTRTYYPMVLDNAFLFQTPLFTAFTVYLNSF